MNILISALLKDALTRKIIKESNQNLYFPEKAFSKILKYKDYIIKKSGLKEEEFVIVISIILNNIKIIPDGDVKDFFLKAKEVFENIDSEDVLFIASALYLRSSLDNKEVFIWSDDKHFDKQNLIRIIKTQDFHSHIK